MAAVFCAVSAASAITWPWAGKTDSASASKATKSKDDGYLIRICDIDFVPTTVGGYKGTQVRWDWPHSVASKAIIGKGAFGWP